jgi:hypothetical protein
MRNLSYLASRGKIQRILHSRDRIGWVSEERPARSYIPQQIDTVFETAAADNAGAIATISQGLQSRYQPVAIYRAREIDPDMAAGVGKRILVTETVGDKRDVPRTPRTCGECPAGGSGYQHRLFPIH